eukprot:m.236508 g.236508  ORF g.236508 m.236508 type:complete len:55 (-) comp16050_c0_seq9:26-190(-)
MWSFQHVSRHRHSTPFVGLAKVFDRKSETVREDEYTHIAFNGFIHVCLKYYYYQ